MEDFRVFCVCVYMQCRGGGEWVLFFLLSVFVKYVLYDNDRLEKNLIMTAVQNIHLPESRSIVS